MAKKQSTQKTAPGGLVKAETLDVATQAEVTFVGEIVAVIKTFADPLGLLAFFRTARRLQDEALEALKRADTWLPPATADEDLAIQREIQARNAHSKSIETHWTITATISRFHKRLTAQRAVGVTADDDAAKMLNGLHFTFAERQRRAAAEENERLRRLEEERQREARNRELDALEDLAVEAEDAAPDCSPRETAFVDNYVRSGGNGRRSAELAGFKDAFKSAARLLASKKIQSAIQAKKDAIAIREQTEQLRQQPVEVRNVAVKADLKKAVGTSERTTWGYEIVDAEKFMAAYRSGEYGIPDDCAQPAPKGILELARSQKEKLDLIPGLRHVKNQGVV